VGRSRLQCSKGRRSQGARRHPQIARCGLGGGVEEMEFLFLPYGMEVGIGAEWGRQMIWPGWDGRTLRSVGHAWVDQGGPCDGLVANYPS
jgi:hypothetical protein